MKRLLLRTGMIAMIASFALAQTPSGAAPDTAPQAKAPAQLAMASPERSAADRLLARSPRTEQAQPDQRNRQGRTVQTAQPQVEVQVSNFVLHPLEAEQVRRAKIENDLLLQQEEHRLNLEAANAIAAMEDRAEHRRTEERHANQLELESTNYWARDAQDQFMALMHTQHGLMERSIATQDQIVNNRRNYFNLQNEQRWSNLHRSQAVIGNAFGELSPIAAGVLNRISHGNEDTIDERFEGQFNSQQSGMMSDVDKLRAQQADATSAVQDNLRLRMEMLTRRQELLYAQRAQLFDTAHGNGNQPRPQR